MPQCVSETCSQEILEAWTFCPLCGTDNRPEDRQTPVQNCSHLFISGKDFCVYCGGRYGDKYFEVPEWSRKVGFGACSLGLVLILLALVFWFIHGQGHGPGYDWISSWYEAPVGQQVRNGNIFTERKGSAVVTEMLFAGAILLALGITAFYAKQSRYYTDGSR